MSHNPYLPPAADTAWAQTAYWQMSGPARTLTRWLWLYVGAVLLSTLGSVAYYSVDPAVDATQALNRDLLIAAAALPLSVVYLTCAVLFGRLLYNSNKNARLFGTYPVHYSPASMVWWFFVPIASLFKPYQAATNVYLASFPNDDSPRLHPRFGAWWGTWIVSNVLSNVSWRLPEDNEALNIAFSLLLLPLEIASAVLAIVIVQAMAWRQDKTARELGLVDPGVSAGTQ